jgi:excisionase family DNA binding protein
MTVPEICARLGISRSTFYDWRQARKAPPCLVLPNAQIRVREADFTRWVDGRMEAPR